MNNMVLFAYILLAIAIVGGAFGQIALKKGVDSLQGKFSMTDLLKPWNLPKVFAQAPLVLVGLIFYVISFMVWLAALTKFDVSFMYPLLSLAYVLVAVFALAFLKENISIYRWLGIALVTVGSFLLLKSA